MEIDENYKIDVREMLYKEPSQSVSWLVQRPLHDINGYSLADAYMRDFRAAQRAARQEKQG